MILGLKNEGNSCYRNSIIQILTNLNIIKNKYIHKYTNKFNYNEQNDQHEFLIYLLDLINDTTSIKYKIPEYKKNILINNNNTEFNKKIIIKSYKNFFDDGLKINNDKDLNNIYISDIYHFIGQLIHILKCNNCNYTKINFEIFRTLNLNIPNNIHNPTIYDCINYTFIEKILDFKCKKCKKNEIIKKTYLWRLPKYLSVLFIRNIFNNNNYIKNNKNILFDKDILLNNYLYPFITEKNNIIYNLNSIAYHFGNVNNGHCISIIKNKNNNNWLLCDDENITNIDNYRIENAYILFYIKQ